MSTEAIFLDKLKITSNLANMFDERKDFNSEKNDESIQTTRKLLLNLSK